MLNAYITIYCFSFKKLQEKHKFKYIGPYDFPFIKVKERR
jgi:hypothetical protein